MRSPAGWAAGCPEFTGEKLRMEEKNPVYLLGKKVLAVSGQLGRAAIYFGKAVSFIVTSPVNIKSVAKQIVEVGIKSIGVVSLSALFTGMVFGFQIGYISTMWLGSPSMIALGTALAMFKELGPTITGLVLSGRVGAQITAELGTMKVTEQIDALFTLGTNPVKFLYVPRLIACIVAVPVLTLYANAVGTFGGFLVALEKFKIPPPVYWHEIVDMIRMDAIWHGFIKSIFFGVIIVMVSCYKGLTCRGGAEGVGKSTTSAVVISMILILIFDFLLTYFLMTIGIGTG